MDLGEESDVGSPHSCNIGESWWNLGPTVHVSCNTQGLGFRASAHRHLSNGGSFKRVDIKTKLTIFLL